MRKVLIINKLENIINRSRGVPTNCLYPIDTQQIAASDTGQNFVVFAAGWGQDEILYALVYDPGSDELPVKLVWRRANQKSWFLGDLTRSDWPRKWFHSNVSEVAQGLSRVFKYLQTSRV